jgi:hypothetical protein
VAQVVKAHLAHATGPQSALEPTHEVGVVEHGPALGMAEYQIVVGLVRRRLVVAIQFARESIRHRTARVARRDFGGPQCPRT